jgi:hypothetical protein
VKVVQKQELDIRLISSGELAISADDIFNYRAGNDDITSLLYQSGYLTIKRYDREYDEYILGFPNEEVKYGFLNNLMPAYAPSYGHTSGFITSNFIKELRAGKVDEFMQRLKAFYKTVPYDITERKEHYFQTIFWTLFAMIGQRVLVEQRTADGRIDAVVETEKYVYVFEFKIDDKATAKDALAQIDSKEYSIPFAFNGKDIVKVGVVFGAEDRQVREWVVG